jgi:putative membrane protein
LLVCGAREELMKRVSLLSVAVAGIVTVCGGCSNTEGRKTPGSEPAERGAAVGTGGAGADVKDDGEFVRDVASKNLAEIELSRMAVDKAVNPAVKAFAQLMLHDHGAAGDKLTSAVSGHGIDLPTHLDEQHEELARELAGKAGPEFDRDYVKAMVEGHQDLAAKLESRLDVQSLQQWKTAAAGRTRQKTLPEPKTEMADVQVRPIASGDEITRRINQWAADTYPVVQKHLDTARALETAAKAGSTD